MIKKLDNKVIVVTGGAGLLGSKFCEQIAINGATPIIADIDEIKSKQVVEDIKSRLNIKNIDFINMNINSKKSIMEALQIIEDKHNRIDALVNNAYPRNKNYGADFFKVKYDDFVKNVGDNLGGYFLASQLFSNFFKDNGGGNILNISSIYGVIAPDFRIYKNTDMTMPVEYAAIKSSLIHLTKYMANYLTGCNIRVNCISPGGIINNQPESFLRAYNKKTLNKGILDPEDICGTLVFLLSDESKFINGQNIIVDDGFTIN